MTDPRDFPGRERKATSAAMIDRLREAWRGALDLYARTSVRRPDGPVSAVIRGKDDLQLVVAHLLMSSPEGDLRVDEDVTGIIGPDPVGIVVTDPRQRHDEERAPSPRAADLAIDVRVVSKGDDRAAVEADVRRLQAILVGKLARGVALCVLDETASPDRGFYEALEASRSVPILRAFDEDLIPARVPGRPGA